MVMSRFSKMSCNLLAVIRLKHSDIEKKGECMLQIAFGAALVTEASHTPGYGDGASVNPVALH
jgi:hypothetical protein